MYNIWSSEYNNFSELIHVLGKETELDKLLERNVFYSYLLWLESTNVFSIDYFKALVKSIEIDIQLKNDHNLYYDLFYNTFFALRKNYFNTFLIPLLNNKRLERFEKTIPYIEADKNTFTIWLMEAYLFQKNSYYIKKIAKTLNPNYLSEEYKIASTYLIYPDSVLKREVFLDKKELRTQQFLNENRIFNLSLKDKNINDIQKSYYELQKFRGDDNNEFKNSLDMIELNYNVFFDTGKADSIYAKIKEAHFQKQIAELSYNSSNKLDIYSSSLSNYLLKKSKEDLEFAINEYLLLNGFKSFYQKKIQPELLKDEKYTSLFKQFTKSVKDISEGKSSFEPFLDLLKFHIYELEKVQTLQNEIKYNDIFSIKDIQKRISKNQVLVVPIVGFGDTIKIKIQKDGLSILKLETIDRLDASFYNKEFIFINDYNLLIQFENMFVSKYKKFPKIRYVNSFFDLNKKHELKSKIIFNFMEMESIFHTMIKIIQSFLLWVTNRNF